MKNLGLTLLALVVATFGTNSAQAAFETTTTFAGTVGTDSDVDANVDGMLVGTSWDPNNDPSHPLEINAIIGGEIRVAPELDKKSAAGVTKGYNKTSFATPTPGFATPLAAAIERVNKFEEVSGPNEFWSLFDYYERNDVVSMGDIEEFWNGARFTQLSTPQDDLFGSGEEKVVGLKFHGPDGWDAGIQYLGAKADAFGGGFTAWIYEPGLFNVIYVDADGDQNYDSTGTDAYDFDVRGDNAVSHISFYGVLVPEPASMAMMGLGGLLVGGALVRRKRKKS